MTTNPLRADQSMSELERYLEELYGRKLTASERVAAERVKRIGAPLGLSEWEVTDGAIYYSGKSALAAQVGINKRETIQ